MIHIGSKAYAPRGIARVTVGARVVFDSAAGSGLTVSIFPSDADGSSASPNTSGVTTNTVTLTVTGGVEPYTYAWVEKPSASGEWIITRPDEKTTAFQARNVLPNGMRTAAFECTVTDARGRTGSETVTATARNYGDQRANTVQS